MATRNTVVASACKRPAAANAMPARFTIWSTTNYELPDKNMKRILGNELVGLQSQILLENHSRPFAGMTRIRFPTEVSVKGLAKALSAADRDTPWNMVSCGGDCSGFQGRWHAIRAFATARPRASAS